MFTQDQNCRPTWLRHWLALRLLGLWLSTIVPTAELFANDEWGTLSGQIIVEGRIPTLAPRAVAVDVCPEDDVPDDSLIVDRHTGGLCYVAIYLKHSPTKIYSVPTTQCEPVVRQYIKNCRFTPHMLCLRTDQKLHVLFQDPLPHLVRYAAFTNSGEGATGEELQEFSLRQAEKLPVKATCSFHPYMCGWWIVLDHPYSAVTDVQGRFRIENLPVGEHEFTIWHERAGYLEKSLFLNILPGEQTLPARLYPMSRFIEPRFIEPRFIESSFIEVDTQRGKPASGVSNELR